MTPQREEVLRRIAAATLVPAHPTRVAVEGITASGTSTVAAELTAAVRRLERPAEHVSMDGFHHLRAHRQGRLSMDGSYEDADDFAALRARLLGPLGPDGDRRYVVGVMDLAADRLVESAPRSAPPDLVLVVDGTFLQRPELAGGWDLVVFVDTAFEIAEERGTRRDAAAFGGEQQAREAYRRRSHAACRRHLAEVHRRDGRPHGSQRRPGAAGTGPRRAPTVMLNP